MTRARMIELLISIEDAGWYCINDDLFFVENETITWNLLNKRNNERRVLIFYLFDHIGRTTERLSHIHYVEEKESELRLEFSKIKSSEWKIDRRNFVRSLYPLNS